MLVFVEQQLTWWFPKWIALVLPETLKWVSKIDANALDEREAQLSEGKACRELSRKRCENAWIPMIQNIRTHYQQPCDLLPSSQTNLETRHAFFRAVTLPLCYSTANAQNGEKCRIRESSFNMTRMADEDIETRSLKSLQPPLTVQFFWWWSNKISEPLRIEMLKGPIVYYVPGGVAVNCETDGFFYGGRGGGGYFLRIEISEGVIFLFTFFCRGCKFQS